MKTIYNSLKKEFYLLTIGITLVIILSSFTYNIYTAYQYNKRAFIDESKLQADLIADSIVDSMLFLDIDTIKTKLLLLGKFNDILQVSIYDNKKQLIAEYTKDDVQKVSIDTIRDKHTLFYKENHPSNPIESNIFIIKKPITLNSVSYGTLYLIKSTDSLNVFLQEALLKASLFLFIMIALTLFLTIKLADKFINPIVKLSNVITNIAKKNDYSIRLHYNEKNEIGNLYNSFNTLFASIEFHQKELNTLTQELEMRVEERTKELEASLQKLQKAQQQIIESEKMAALGSLVSGVAHEINTPLGNALTGTTIIHRDAKELLAHMHNNTLKKSILQSTLKNLEETSTLVASSLSRAANLVKSFKQISVDQSIEELREYNIYDYTNEVLLTFKSKLKTVPVHAEVQGDSQLQIRSYPGAYAQILNNLIQNSLLHAFEPKEENAKITITLKQTENSVEIRYSDNGKGVDPEVKNKIFDPFVTTKRNSGGTGLGMNILYNIVTQQLKGTIKFESEPNKGVTFIITLPKNL